MKLYYPDFYKSFRCLAGACPDSCCRQGWQIPVDAEHLAWYETLPGALGDRVRAALRQEDGETVLAMENGVCALLDENGLCPLAAQYGEDGLCWLCHTHPRFVEEYGGTRELHFSLSCPEAARLALERQTPIGFCTETVEEPVTAMNDIDPVQYFALLGIRDFAIRLMQHRQLSMGDRLALLLLYAEKVQRRFDAGRYADWKFLARRWCDPDYRARLLSKVRRLRRAGTDFLPDVDLLRSLDRLTDELPPLLHEAVFTCRSAAEFDREHAVALEHLTVLWLAHYIPKAVNDGRVDTKILLAAFLMLTVRRFSVCSGGSPARLAGLLAKEIEHSEENLDRLYTVWEREPGWSRHFIAQLDL